MARIFESHLRVRYAETDAQGVVYYANHLVWFEVGRVGLLRDLGVDFDRLADADACFVIAEATCRYLAPAHFDDEIVVQTWVESVGRSSFTLAYAVLNRTTGRRAAEGRTVQVVTTLSGERRPIEIPPELRAALVAAS